MIAPPVPSRLLDEADRLLRDVVPETRGLWPRAVAFLTRLALEQSLDTLWGRERPELAACPMRAQLLLLPRYIEPALAAEVGEAWTALSRATHHHPYELGPTATELRRHLQTAARFEETVVVVP